MLRGSTAMIASASLPRRRSSHLRRDGPIFAIHNCPFSLRYRPPHSSKGLLRRAGGIDPRPVQRTKIVILLAPGDGGIRVGSITAAPREPNNSLVDSGLEKKPVERRTEGLGGCCRPGAFLRSREDRIHDRRVAVYDRAARLVDHGGIQPCRPTRHICNHRQPFRIVPAV